MSHKRMSDFASFLMLNKFQFIRKTDKFQFWKYIKYFDIFYQI